MDLSISVVNWNTRTLLHDCLRSIYSSPAADNLTFEVIVVDNASTDGSAAMVKAEFPQARLIPNSENVGYARANNQAMKVGRGRYFLILNSDTRIVGDALADLVGFMDAHPDAGAAGPKIVDAEGNLQLSGAYFPGPAIVFWGGVLLNQALERLLPGRSGAVPKFSLLAEEHEGVRKVDWVLGACLITRREAILAVDGMDPDIFFYFEEVDLCYRLKQNGWRVWFFGQAEIVHLQGQSYRELWDLKEQVGRRLAGLEYFYRKHYGRAALASLQTAMVVGSLMKMAAAAILYMLRRQSARQLGREKFWWHWFTVKWYALRLIPIKRAAR